MNDPLPPASASAQSGDATFIPGELAVPFEEEEFAFPLSPAQMRIWEAERAFPRNSAYNGSFRWELTGSVELRTLERAFNEIIRRHEILRATFREVDGSPVQIIAPSVRLKAAFRDLRYLSPSLRQDEMDRLCSEEARRCFDLENGPLLRVGLLQMDDDRSILMFTVHHIVSDGWSIGLIMEELQKIYAAFAEDREPSLPDLRVQYPDYVIWQRDAMEQPEALRQLAYWKKKLSGYERLEVATDFERPLERTTSSAIVSELLPRELSDSLKQFGDQHHGTLFITGLAACMALLARYTGKDDIAVGSPLAGRNRTELETLVGMFVNHVVLRASAAGDPTFPEFVSRVRETVWEAFANQDIPFENVLNSLAEDGGQPPSPFYAVNFICQREYARASTFVFDFAGIRMRTMPSKSQGALYDLNFFMVEREMGWRLSLEYNVDLYGEKTALGMLQDFCGLLDAIASNPDRKLSEFPFPAADARRGVGTPLAESASMTDPAEMSSNTAPAREVYAMPASAVQKRFWLLDRLFSGNSAFQLPACVRLSGPVSANLLEQSFQSIVDRHEILRTTFEEIDGELAQIVAPSSPFALAVTSLENLPEEQRESRVQQLIREEAQQPFDLQRAPAFRARLFRLSPEHHVLAVTAHHILTDGWSHRVLQNELWSIYEALLENRDPQLAPLPIQFGDFVAWQKEWLASDEARAHLDFWMKRLASPLPVLELPADRNPEKQLSPHGAMETLLLPVDLAASLKALTHTESATMFALLLTSFVALLAHSTAQDDIVIGSPVANRRAETEPLIGPFAGPVALRFDLSGNPTLREALHRVRDVTLDALAHSDLPFESVLEKITPRSVHGHNPLFQFYFYYQSAFLQPRNLPGLSVAPLPTFSIGTSFEIQVGVIEREEGIRIQLEYNPELFSQASIQRFLTDYHTILRLLAQDSARRISELPVAAPPATKSAPADSKQNDFVPPRDAVECDLARIWADVLGQGKIGIRDDFFDLGGHSLLAARLLKNIQDQLGKELALASLLDASTIERQARLIRPGPGPLAPGESGNSGSSQIPFFYLGAYPTFRRLTQRLAGACEFHSLGMQESICRELGPSPRLEPIAAQFVRAIRERRPHGPYMLGGWCSHGVLALEIAQQLRVQGEDVALVVMIEGANPTARAAYPKWKRFISAVQLKFSLFRFESFYLRHIKRSEGLAYVQDRIRTKIANLAGFFTRTGPKKQGPVPILYKAVDNYEPRPYLGRVLLMRGRSKSFGLAKDPRLGWGNLLTDLTVGEVHGSHFSIMGADSEGLARKITQHVTEVEQRFSRSGSSSHQILSDNPAPGSQRA